MKCIKPNCDCIEIAEFHKGDQPVKSYPCLAGEKLRDTKKEFEDHMSELINKLKEIVKT